MADITTTRQFTDGEKGITAAKLNDIIASSTIQPAFVSSKPVASSAAPTDNLLLLKSAGTYAQVPFQTVIDSVNAGLPSSDSEIWSVRLRSFNAIGNPNFEVDQRQAGQGLSNPASGLFPLDRWYTIKSGVTLTGNWNQPTEGVPVPGTSFNITRSYLRFGLLTQQLSLGTSDVYGILQSPEGTQYRELMGDVTSLSLMVRSSVANLKFSVSLRDPGSTRSLVKLCTIPTANVWTLIKLPNLPIPSGGTFPYMPGQAGYVLNINLVVGPNFVAPAADTWQNGNFVGAPGMSNFAASAANSSFDISFVQHEPGPVCSTFMDKPFSQNLDECLRYYQKTYDYGTKPATVASTGILTYMTMPGQHPYGAVPYKKIMAKVPTTITGYSPATGTAGTVRDLVANIDRVISAPLSYGDSGFSGFGVTTQNAGTSLYQFHYTADTGW
jgi:hypothetical protein